MGPQRFISATSQRWKLVLALAALLASALIILLQTPLATMAGEVAALRAVLLATIASLTAFVAPCLSVRCPLCGCKLLWRAVSTRHSTSWLLWLLSIDRCPHCNFVPAHELRGARQPTGP